MAASRLLVVSSFLFGRPGFESSSPKGRCSHWPYLSYAGPYWLQPAVPHCVQHLDQAALKSDLKVGFGPYTGALLRTFAFSQIDVLRE